MILLIMGSLLSAYDWAEYIKAEHEIISKDSILAKKYIHPAVHEFCNLKGITNEDTIIDLEILSCFPLDSVPAPNNQLNLLLIHYFVAGYNLAKESK